MAINKEMFAIATTDYDERLLEGRLPIEGNVCGCMLKDLELYDDSSLSTEDFITKHGRLLFSLITRLREKGYSHCDELGFMSILSEEEQTNFENAFGGYKQIDNIINAVSAKNWEAFLDALSKSNALMHLYTKGFNLFNEITLDNGTRVIPFDFFKELTASEVLEFYEGQIATMQAAQTDSKLVGEGYIEFDDAWLTRLKNKEQMGVSYGEAGYDIDGEVINTFRFMSQNTLGLKPGTLSGWGSASGTGKTTYMVTVAMSLASKGERVVMVTNESDLDDLKALFLTWVLYRVFKYENLSKRKLLSGELDDEDLEYIAKAKKFWTKNYSKNIKVVSLSDADALLSCRLIKKAILREGASTFIVDTMKMTLDQGEDSVWVGLIKDVRALTELAIKYNVIGIITVQLALSTTNRSWLDSSCLANCKQIKETLSNLVLFRKLYSAELDPESPFFIKPFRRKQKDDGSGEWYDEPYEADPTKTWIVAFSDKTRRGIDSGVDGSAFLCRTDLDHASFYETARCYPSRRLFTQEDRRN